MQVEDRDTKMASIFVNFPLIDSRLSAAGILFHMMSGDVLKNKISITSILNNTSISVSLSLCLFMRTMFVCIFDNKSALHEFIIPSLTKPIANAPYICIIASGYKL